MEFFCRIAAYVSFALFMFALGVMTFHEDAHTKESASKAMLKFAASSAMYSGIALMSRKKEK